MRKNFFFNVNPIPFYKENTLSLVNGGCEFQCIERLEEGGEGGLLLLRAVACCVQQDD